MRIGILAARAGITASRVRFYEAEGLLPRPPRRESGYRDYDEEALADLRLIQRAIRLGYTLRDIASYLRTPDQEGRRTLILGCIDGRLAQVNGQLTGLKGQQERLQSLLLELQATNG